MSNVDSRVSNADSEVSDVGGGVNNDDIKTSSGDIRVSNVDSGVCNAAAGDSNAIDNVNNEASSNTTMTTNSDNFNGSGDIKIDKNDENCRDKCAMNQNKTSCDQSNHIQTGSKANHKGTSKDDTDKRINWQLQLNGRYEKC